MAIRKRWVGRAVLGGIGEEIHAIVGVVGGWKCGDASRPPGETGDLGPDNLVQLVAVLISAGRLLFCHLNAMQMLFILYALIKISNNQGQNDGKVR